MWIGLALGAALLTSLNPIFYKRMLQGTTAIVVVWGITLLSLPLLIAFTVVLSPQFPSVTPTFWLAVAGAGLLNTIAQIASLRAYQLEDVSLITPLLIFSPVFTVVLGAIFLDERPTMLGVVGVLCVLIGAYWLNRSKGQSLFAPLRALALKPGVLLVLLAGLIWAITPIVEKVAISATTPTNPRLVAVGGNVFLLLFLAPFVLRRRREIEGLRRASRNLVWAAIIAGTAPVLGFTALSLGLAGYVTTLFKLGTLLTLVWSYLLLDEKKVLSRLPAAGIMVVGAILIALF